MNDDQIHDNVNLFHYSSEPWTLDRSRTYVRDLDRMWFKPTGLWLSVGDDWERWCRGEEFNLEGLRYKTEVVLVSDANVLRLADEDDIDRFTQKYTDHLSHNRMPGYVNWMPVVQQYSGIIIAPYCWPRRLTDHTMWYYSWDCASACIWDLSAIAKEEVSA